MNQFILTTPASRLGALETNSPSREVKECGQLRPLVLRLGVASADRAVCPQERGIYSASALAVLSVRGEPAAKEPHQSSCPPPSLSTANSAKPALLCLGVFCFASLQLMAAQPKITEQPLNAAVLLGQDARFTVTASGRAPLTYQWRFDGRDLAGATNRILTVANVALSGLGRYDVVVRDTAGAVTSDPAWLLLASRWTELVVFGASAELQTCGGFAWPDYVANSVGVRLRNYAQDGARSSGIRSQIATYLSGNAPTTNTLIGHWAGGSFIDLRFGFSPEKAASNRLANVRLLVEAGARHLLMPTMWPPEVVADLAANFPKFTSEQVVEFDARVTEGLNVLQTEYELTVYRPAMFEFFLTIQENPKAYGFKVPLGGDTPIEGNFTCDTQHFTTSVHRLASHELYRSLTPPVRIEAVARTLDGNMVIDWVGGLPPFRVERSADLFSGEWQPVSGLGFVSSATIKPANLNEFFRVLCLGQ